MGSQNRFKGCIFPFGIRQPIEKIYETPSWRSNLGISSSLLWPKHSPPDFYVSHETIGKNLEESGYNGFCVSRRHTPCWSNPMSSTVSFKDSSGHFEKIWFHHQFSKVHTDPNPKYQPLGFQFRPPIWSFKSTKGKAQGNEKGVGQTGNPHSYVKQKDGSNFWGSKILTLSITHFKSLYRHFCSVCQQKHPIGLGFCSHYSKGAKGSIVGSQKSFVIMGGKTLHSKSHNSSSFRQFTIGMGRGQPYRWQANSRILEGSIIHAHKYKIVGGSHKNSEKFCKRKGNSFVISGQQGGISLPARGGGFPT